VYVVSADVTFFNAPTFAVISICRRAAVHRRQIAFDVEAVAGRESGHSNFPRFAVGLMPPFLMVFALAHAVLPRRAAIDTLAPMSSYLNQQASGRFWKISMTAGVTAGLNFLFMLFISIPPHN
jgi:hypothetical protein